MTGTSEHGSGWSDLDAARLLLGKLGVKPADLMAAPTTAEFPLIADYIPLVEKAVTKGTRRVYSPYWAKVVREWGHRRVNEPTALEISQLAEQVREGAVQRRNARGGRGAAEHLIGALRCMYGYLVADGILTQAENPAARAAKPRRLRSARMALPDSLSRSKIGSAW
jgi:integrase/recombinase XerC